MTSRAAKGIGTAKPYSTRELLSQMPVQVIIGNSALSIEEVVAAARHRANVQLSPKAHARMNRSHALLQEKLAAGESIYGVTTGFGGNSNYQIPATGLRSLQSNLLTFLKAGTGNHTAPEVVRAAMLLRANALAQGWSCPRVEVVQQLISFLNLGITPLVPEFGSVGASGDLIPSAYVANCLCGTGQVIYNGAVMLAAEAMQLCGLPPLALEAKEGLALCNGTTMMTALAVFSFHQADCSFHHALGAIALAAEAMESSSDYYAPRIQEAKGHPGQIAVAATLRRLLDGSKLVKPLHVSRAQAAVTGKLTQETQAVAPASGLAQAPYSLRCVPQGLGPMWEALQDTRAVVEREVNSVNDNPLIDPESGEVLYTGNFYGGHIARSMDCLKIDVSTLANWLHSIVAMLMDSRFSNGLPNSLSPNVGLYQGFKGLQLCHSSLVTFLRQQSSPSSVHTLPTEQYNQDVVSLGTHSALTALRTTDALRDVVAMTLLAAAQAVDLRGGAPQLGSGTLSIYRAVRRSSDVLEEDRALDEDIAALSAYIDNRLQ